MMQQILSSQPCSHSGQLINSRNGQGSDRSDKLLWESGNNHWCIWKVDLVPFHTPKIFGPLPPRPEIWIFKKRPPQKQPKWKKNHFEQIVLGVKNVFYRHKYLLRMPMGWPKKNSKIFKNWPFFELKTQKFWPTLNFYCQSCHGWILLKFCTGAPKNTFFDVSTKPKDRFFSKARYWPWKKAVFHIAVLLSKSVTKSKKGPYLHSKTILSRIWWRY